MKKIVLVAAFLVSAAPLALAANVHFVPPTTPGSFTDEGLVLNIVGKIAGLGNQSSVINMSATGNASIVCLDSAGTVVSTAIVPIVETGSLASVKHGNVVYSVTTQAPLSPVPGSPDCANPSQTELITDVSFAGANLSVESPAGTPVLVATCTFAPPTVDGPVPPSHVSCTVAP